LISLKAPKDVIMKLVTWNVNSINARQRYVEMFLDEVDPDLLCIQELKMPTQRVPVSMFADRGYHVAVHGQSRWNGVLIASKTPLEDVHCGLPAVDEGQSRLIAATTQGLRIVNLYCPQGSSQDSPKFQYKLKFFDGLSEWLANTLDPKGPVVVTGDINIARNPDDVWSVEAFTDVPTYHPKEHKRWDKLISWGLSDAVRPHIAEGTFSFWDYRGGSFYRNQGMRIDHFLVTDSVLHSVTGAEVLRDWRKMKKVGSDPLTASVHAPVSLPIDW